MERASGEREEKKKIFFCFAGLNTSRSYVGARVIIIPKRIASWMHF